MEHALWAGRRYRFSRLLGGPNSKVQREELRKKFYLVVKLVRSYDSSVELIVQSTEEALSGSAEDVVQLSEGGAVSSR